MVDMISTDRGYLCGLDALAEYFCKHLLYFDDCLMQQRVIDVLKVDAESAEWPFLRNILNEDSDQLDTIRQLLLELHTPRFKPHQMTKVDEIEMMFYAKKLKTVGFAVFCHREKNVCCRRFSPMMPPGVTEKCCQESFYVNQRFLGA